MPPQYNPPYVIVALDYPDSTSAKLLLDRLDPKQCRIKIGKELFTRSGPQFVETCVNAGFDVFLDLKYHDIPNTVAAACRAAAELGVWMVNVHAQGGGRMMSAAREAIDRIQGPKPLLIAVTVLTSMDEHDLQQLGVQTSAQEWVLKLAELARTASMDGLVCSAQEVTEIRQCFGSDLCLVTPGIRPANSTQTDDQRRVMTPQQARAAGSNYLVIGRPITAAADPLAALEAINQSLK